MDKDVEFFIKKFNVSRETIEKLNKYKDFLVISNKLLNLIGKTTENHIFSRHFTDSAQIYDLISGLSNEVKRKLNDIKPLTFGQALRIDGVTPAAINILMIYCKNTLKKAS